MNINIIKFFDEMSISRDAKLSTNLMSDYEQKMRQKAVLELIKIKNGESILDVGCGNLRDVRVLAKKTKSKIYGIDISEGMLREGINSLNNEQNSFYNIYLLRASCTHLPFLNKSFDRIICSEVLEHVPEYELCIKEISRCLKDGGICVITTPNRISLYGLNRKFIESANKILKRRSWAHPYDEWKTENEICSLLEKHGFKIENKVGICFLPGFSFYHILPSQFAIWIVKLIGVVEPILRYKLHKFGYMVGISASKTHLDKRP